MQVVYPIDIEDALRLDLAVLRGGFRFFAPPIPSDLKAGDVLIQRVGGARVSGASHDYDVTVACYAKDAAKAVEMANEVHGLIVSRPLRETSTQYSNANANTPYEDNDPRAPRLARQSFRATVTCPGNRIKF